MDGGSLTLDCSAPLELLSHQNTLAGIPLVPRTPLAASAALLRPPPEFCRTPTASLTLEPRLLIPDSHIPVPDLPKSPAAVIRAMYPQVSDRLRKEKRVNRGTTEYPFWVTELYEPFESLWTDHKQHKNNNELTSFITAQGTVFNEAEHQVPSKDIHKKIEEVRQSIMMAVRSRPF
jgi:hypothetical protein